jgi:predicted phage tail protein
MAATAAHYTPRTKILLTGPLAKRFGAVHWKLLDTGRVWEGFKAMNCTVEGFEEEIKRLSRLGMRFAIFRNRKNVGTDGFDLGGTQELKIVPIIGGSKRAGIIQSVVGVVLIAAGYGLAPFTGGASMALVPVGLALVAGGIVQMLSPQLKGLNTSAAADNQPSDAFGSAKNTTASGNPVPICIGERRWGGAIISASIYAEDKT